ncbi:MAG: hypothetical protein LIP09_10520 [Bacteroidales bacterium]|nr:hypothetical protein [Bacteroidales bacterium]
MKFIELTLWSKSKLMLNTASIIAVLPLDLGARIILTQDVFINPNYARSSENVLESYDQIMEALGTVKC